MRKLQRLQAVRAIAASAVVIDHVLGLCVSSHALPETFNTVDWSIGHLGVDVFFVISGFIMIRMARDKYAGMAGARAFVWDRISRIVPVYWIAIILSALLIGRNQPISSGNIIKSLLFIPYLDKSANLMRPILALGWTLNYEMFFYIIFSLSLMLRRSATFPAILIALLALVLIGSTFHTLMPYAEPETLAQFWTDPIILFFGLGIVIGFFEDQLTALLPVPPFQIFAIVGVLALTVGVSVMSKLTYPMPLAWQAGYALASGVCVLLCITRRDLPPSPLTRFLVARGDDSFCTYVFQFLILSACYPIIYELKNRIFLPYIIVLFAVISANIVGWATNTYLARPMTRAFRRPHSIGR